MRQDVLCGLDECHLAAEAAHGLRHFDAHGPAAEHEQAAGDGFHAGGLAVGPDSVELAQSGDGRHDRIGTVRQDDVFGGVAYAGDLDDAGPGEPAAAAQELDAGVLQPALLAAIGVVRHHEVTPGKRRLDVDLRAGRCLPRRIHSLAGA